jgi:hypothetical protein
LGVPPWVTTTLGFSPVTGPETHSTPLGENDDIGDDCADDEHVSDTESIRTDGRAHNLPQETEHSLTHDFANHIIENLTLDKLKDLFGQSDALEAIAELVRDFVIFLGVGIEDNAVQTRAVTFVRHKRRIIARCLASAATAWRPSAEGQVSIGEKMRQLHFDDADPSQYEDPNAERRFAEPDEDTDRLDELHLSNDNTPELRDVVLAKGFLLNSDELPWMIDRIRRMESLSNTGNIWASVRGQIARVIESGDQQIDLTLHWDVLQTLHEQYDRDESRPARLSDMIVYNGTASCVTRALRRSMRSRYGQHWGKGLLDLSTVLLSALTVSLSSHYTVTWSSLSINGGTFLTVGTTFNIGRKDLTPALKSSEARAYDSQIQDASDMTVLLYSTRDRRGWLIDGASALVHLSRAWLTSKSAEHKNPEAIRQLHYTEDNGGRDSTIELFRANKEIKIFEDTAEIQETSVAGESASEQEYPSTDSGYVSLSNKSISQFKQLTKRTTSQWTYKALVIDSWRNLEAMKAKIDHLKRQGPEIRVRLPSRNPTLTGWDVSDFLLGRSPLEPRFVELESESKSWNKFVKEISSVPLMAESFYEIISPLDGSKVCKSMPTLPIGRDLLAVPLSVLHLTEHRFLRWEENLALDCIRISDYTFMFGSEPSTEPCRCTHGSHCETVSVLGKKAKQGPGSARSIFERFPHAAVIIGMRDVVPLWKRMSPNSNSSTRSALPAAEYHTSSSSSSETGITSGAHLDPFDSQHELSEKYGDPQSGDSVYVSCEEE